MTYIPQIPIEDLVYIEFVEFPQGPDERAKLVKALTKACKAGNLHKTKHILVFTSTNGILRVKGTVWMVGKSYVLLKQNVHIPIASIREVI